MAKLTAASTMLAITLPLASQAGTFTFRDFNIPGATSVNIAAINDFGVATGTYGSATRPNSAGFAGRRGQITVIANYAVGGPNPAVPFPADITNDGTVIGTVYTGLTSVFTWKGGAYTNTFGGGTYFTGPYYVRRRWQSAITSPTMCMAETAYTQPTPA